MWKRSLLFCSALVAVGAGVWAGVNYAGTEAAPWIEGGLGALMILAGAGIFLARDPVDQRSAQLSGGGIATFGVAQLLPSTWSLGATLIGVALMVAAITRRRRRIGAARPSH